MFIDQAKIFVKAGSGGKGCNSFYRDKYTRQGIPDGGDGGSGADIIIRADRNLHTLLDFQYNRHFVGAHGGHGSGKNQKGKDAQAIIIRVPCGTVIKEAKTDCVLRDLTSDKEEVVAASGGKGGRGNQHRRPVTEAQAGEEKELFLDLKVIADAGVIGFPNAGKSTLISHISGAHPKVAAYPFTTKFPILGVVRSEDDSSFIIADIPGLIEGASFGRGLGDKFLRHVERTKVLVHIVDMSASEGRDPVEDYKVINKELKSYSSDLHKKQQIVVANKMDLEASAGNLTRFKKAIKKKIYPISALKKEGLEELVAAISKKL
ncbi:MAG: GTPase ObgE [Candidatus Omnitrophica bacterium]|nr:GTPase ObgE [Candidatus Omnitrophota bacterium]